MKTFEMLQESPTFDTETWSEQMLLEKWWFYRFASGSLATHLLQVCKTTHYLQSTIKQVLYAYTSKSLMYCYLTCMFLV